MNLAKNYPGRIFVLSAALATLAFCGCASDPVSKNVTLASAIRRSAPNCELHSVVLQRVSGDRVSANLRVSRPGARPDEFSVEMVAGTLTPESQGKLSAYAAPAKRRIVPETSSDEDAVTKSLFQAVRSGNAAAVQNMMSKGVNPNATEIGKETRLTPLSIAVQRNDIPTVRVLLQNGANPDAEVRFGSIQYSGTFDRGTAIHLATCNGSEAMIRLLARYGANLDAVCVSDERFSRNVNALGLAIKIKRYNIVRTLLANGANADVPCDVNARVGSSYKDLPVFKSEDETNRMLNIFVEAGADMDVGESTATPLVRAVENGNAELVEKMLRLGANPNFEHDDPNLRLRNGKRVSVRCTPIFHVKNPVIAEILVRSGADLNYEISEGLFSPNYRVLDVVGNPETRIYLNSVNTHARHKR